jgi:hypothetical protein
MGWQFMGADGTSSDRAGLPGGRQSSDHFVQFYDRDELLLDCVERYIRQGLAEGAAGIVIATRSHLQQLEKRWIATGMDLQAARDAGRYVPLDAEQTLASLLFNEWPQYRLFSDVVEPVLVKALKTSPRVVAFGEMVGLLWRARHYGAALQLEALWSALAKKHAFTLFCAYPMSAGAGVSEDAVRRVCAEHSRAFDGRVPGDES